MNQIKFKTSIMRIFGYSDAYIHVNWTIEIKNTAADVTAANNRNKNVTLKNSAPFIDCISRINVTQANDSHNDDVVVPVYNLIECSDNSTKTSGILWQFHRDEPPLGNNNVIIDCPADTNNNGNSNNNRNKQTTIGQKMLK